MGKKKKKPVSSATNEATTSIAYLVVYIQEKLELKMSEINLEEKVFDLNENHASLNNM